MMNDECIDGEYKSRQKVVIYRDKKGLWRWRFVSNGRIMADSSEGYASKRNAKRAWDQFERYIFTCVSVEIDDR